jgi:hypothetical protein
MTVRFTGVPFPRENHRPMHYYEILESPIQIILTIEFFEHAKNISTECRIILTFTL